MQGRMGHWHVDVLAQQAGVHAAMHGVMQLSIAPAPVPAHHAGAHAQGD